MTRIFLFLAFALSLSPAAQAQTEGFLGLVDTDGDGAITRDEVIALRLALFDRIDSDADGNLTRAEIEAAKANAEAYRAARDPWRLDADGDGTLSEAEFTAATPGFDRADRDGDGVLSPAEVDRVKRLRGALGGGLE